MEKKKSIAVIGLIVIIFAAVCVGLAFAMTKQQQYKNELENVYQKSYYEAMDTISDIELKLSKLTVSEGKSTQKKLLEDVWRQSELAETNLSQLSQREQEMVNVIKFINQLGDYCHFLSLKLEKEKLSDTEQENINKLYDIVLQLLKELQSVQGSIMDGGRLVGSIGQGLNFLNDSFKNINSSSVDYPELIYDGPFSDGLNDRIPKFLDGKTEVSVDEAIAVIKSKFDGVTDVKLMTETTGSIPTYMFELSIGSIKGLAQVTKIGGIIAMYDSYQSIDNPNLTEDECSKIADEYMVKLGYKVKRVWVSNNHSTIYINYAAEQDNVVLYPDLIKVKVSADDGKIIGIEARNYIYNHIDRKLEKPKDINEARAVVSKKISIETSALTLIPTEYNTEVLAYEFSGRFRDYHYFVYIDAITLQEIKVMRVIDDDGKLIV